jgi:hypothetical protein
VPWDCSTHDRDVKWLLCNILVRKPEGNKYAGGKGLNGK